MKRNLLTLVVTMILGASLASAQASRTWVSGVGDDANPCSRTAPCKTFAGAISKTAPGGEIDALDPGGFGALTITKAITIDGGGGQVASVLVSGTNGIVVQANASTDIVILRNLRINGISSGLNGIQMNSAKGLIIQNCDIFGFNQNGINITSAGGKVTVDNTTSSNNAGNGLNIVATATTTVSVDHSRFEFNQFGIFAGNFSKVSVSNSVAAGNSDGFVSQAGAGTADLTITRSTAANNTFDGILSGGGATASVVRVSATSISGNGTGLHQVAPGQVFSFTNTNFDADTNAGTITPLAPI